MASVVWFRRDLRTEDHPALVAAAAAGPVAPLFVLDERLLKGRWASPNRNAFLRGSLAALDLALRELGSGLHVRIGRPEEAVPAFAREAGAESVFVSRDYTPFSRRRDEVVARALARHGIAWREEPGTLVHEPGDVRSNAGDPFSVFSPFVRRWRELPMRKPLAAPPALQPLGNPGPGEFPGALDFGDGEAVTGLPEVGERAARQRLAAFVSRGLEGYAQRRDLLAAEGTSRLSQDLRFGLLSPVSVVSAVTGRGFDAEKFVSELAWRDFYAHVLWHHPRVLREPFQNRYAGLEWDDDEAKFDAWRQGRTGFPVVDAAMRQLLATGFMHNRARMIVASFLTKDLHIDWRRGEAHFMRHLVDGDPANNNGGWQWAASVGTDAQPFFRVFNPTLQGKTFDPDGAYVRRWVPELGDVPGPYVHEPWRMAASRGGPSEYPSPIVDHAVERRRAIEMYRAATGSG